ncbi:uncharacterized protein LOC124264777 isoform X1 [Haliotis rubra]|uniref:uncharacterized protein LOC124264777 isoform X1 n=1 Tax=Haliotis rubra TaxID=36100 RepID=UPI001EE6222E|nr:uncharacterized protein LOC124264777 isoform X1 [Haliotis rubra]
MDKRCAFLSAVTVMLAAVCLKGSVCQVYSWSVPVPLNISVCSNSLSNPLILDWTYTPTTPDPLIIEWSKQGTNRIFDNIATYTGGTFIPSAAYTGRVTRTGSTAEIAIQGPLTAADAGIYQVSVTDSGGHNLPGFANVIVPVVNEPINGSCVETASDSYTVTCSVDVSPPVTLQLKKGSDFVDSASSDSGLSQTVSSAGTYQCSVTGQGSECVTPNSKEVICTSGTLLPCYVTQSDRTITPWTH